MIVPGALAVALNSATVVARVGPIVAGESMADVRQRLGPGTPVSTCGADPKLKADDCARELDYGDGANLLKVTFGAADRRVITVKIVLRASQGRVAAARLPRGTFATWTWAGHRIDRMPTTKVVGWSGPVEPVEKDCFVSYEGPTLVSGAKLYASYQCAAGTARVGEFATGLADP